MLKMRRTSGIFLALAAGLCFSGCRKSDYMVDETESIRDNGAGTGTVTWTKEKDYLLEGLVFVNDGQTLTIEAGTVIRARTGQGAAASALIVARGGRILARGTASEPIIFTCEGDDLEGSVPPESKGLWGGVILLGSAPLNNQYNENHIEGIPFTEPRGTYGGIHNEDDSGILQYVSIRHGGTKLSEDNEINGLTLGGVGSGTTIENIEVISNADDGFEFFGGTVNCRYLLSAFCSDDAFDYDEGYCGRGQYWVAIQELQTGDHLIEANGGILPENGRPLYAPLLFNLTLVGSGTASGRTGISFTRNAAGVISNTVVLNQEYGVEIEYKPGVEDSYEQFVDGMLQLQGNVFYDVADNDTLNIFRVICANPSENLTDQFNSIRGYFSTAGNKVENPGMVYGGEQFRLVAGDYVFGGLAPYPDDWFDKAYFQGAFGTYNWASGWTLLSQAGILLD
jgi:hypothetical protein